MEAKDKLMIADVFEVAEEDKMHNPWPVAIRCWVMCSNLNMKYALFQGEKMKTSGRP